MIQFYKFPLPLPPELCTHIANYYLRGQELHRCAVYYALDTFPKVAGHVSSKFRITRGLRARYIAFECARYIAALKQTRTGSTRRGTSRRGTSRRRNDPDDSSYVIDTAWLTADHLGVRKIIFGNSTKPLLTSHRRPGVWWETVRLPIAGKIEAHTDSVKLRGLTQAGDSRATVMPRSTIWAVPHPSPELLRYHDLGQNHGLIRMVPLDCNKPKITGYSALFHHRIMKIHAHTSNKDLRCYSTEECHGQWTYFPIDEDELVIAIWHCRFQMTPSDILLFLTSRGRVMVIGRHPRLSQLVPTFTILDCPARGGHQLFYDYSSQGISLLAFQRPSPEPNANHPVFPIPELPYPVGVVLEAYTFTSASLANITELAACRTRGTDKPAILGLLFRYADGRRTSVGQVRLDYLAEPLEVKSSESMYLGFARTHDGCPYVDSVESFPSRRDITYLKISWEGNMEWWFSHRQCVVHCNGHSSQDPRLSYTG
ncbi:hypothetical protein EV126DRAFT_159646 [Verticillium dahliae]|nr:hypothetical protein EV126DRAFT_159646 [Verticillium dahliae]